MRIAVDTNVLVSGLLLKSSRVSLLMEHILTDHTLLLSSYVIDELRFVASKKFPEKLSVIDELLSQMNYERIDTPEEIDDTLFAIRDRMDYPVLYSAILAKADILITGDKDFSDITVRRPTVMTPAAFMDTYVFPVAGDRDDALDREPVEAT